MFDLYYISAFNILKPSIGKRAIRIALYYTKTSQMWILKHFFGKGLFHSSELCGGSKCPFQAKPGQNRATWYLDLEESIFVLTLDVVTVRPGCGRLPYAIGKASQEELRLCFPLCCCEPRHALIGDASALCYQLPIATLRPQVVGLLEWGVEAGIPGAWIHLHEESSIETLCV